MASDETMQLSRRNCEASHRSRERGRGKDATWDAYLLELLDGTLVNTTALVDQVTGLDTMLAV